MSETRVPSKYRDKQRNDNGPGSIFKIVALAGANVYYLNHLGPSPAERIYFSAAAMFGQKNTLNSSAELGDLNQLHLLRCPPLRPGSRAAYNFAGCERTSNTKFSSPSAVFRT